MLFVDTWSQNISALNFQLMLSRGLKSWSQSVHKIQIEICYPPEYTKIDRNRNVYSFTFSNSKLHKFSVDEMLVFESVSFLLPSE